MYTLSVHAVYFPRAPREQRSGNVLKMYKQKVYKMYNAKKKEMYLTNICHMNYTCTNGVHNTVLFIFLRSVHIWGVSNMCTFSTQ